MDNFFKTKNGSTSTLGVLISLVMIGLLLVTVSVAISKNVIFNKNKYTDEKKLDVFNSILNKELDPTKNNFIYSQKMSTSSSDAYFFFSKGTGPIILKYVGEEKDTNGDFIFQRPNVDVCDDLACICYSFNALFWQQIDDEPYISPIRLYSSEDKNNPWSDSLMTCKAVENTNTIFTNSRGLDRDFIDAKTNFTSLEIPVILQSDAKQYLETLFWLSTSKKGTYNAVQVQNKFDFLKENYVWEGGVMVGGIATVKTDEDALDHKLSIPSYDITFEKIPNSNVVGICLQDKCLYEKAIEKAKTSNEVEALKQRLYLKNQIFEDYIMDDFTPCLNTLPSDLCLPDLIPNIENLLTYVSGENDVVLTIKKTTLDPVIQISSPNQDDYIFTWPVKMPTKESTQVDEIIFSNLKTPNHLDPNDYEFQVIRQLDGLTLDLIKKVES